MEHSPANARLEIERRNKCHDYIVKEIGAAGQHNYRSLQEGVVTYGAYNAFTRELRRVI